MPDFKSLKKVYRIFISSCIRLLEDERRMLSDAILKSENLPIQMEFSFSGSNNDYSIELDIKKIQESDGIIFILSYLYGEEIGLKIGNKDQCPLKKSNCNLSCYIPNSCNISFTQFEYEYAKCLNKPIVVALNKEYNNITTFKKINDSYTKSGKMDCEAAFYNGLEKNKNFVKAVTMTHSLLYSNVAEFQSSCSILVSNLLKSINEREKIEKTKYGLIPYYYYWEAKSAEESLQQLRKNCIEAIYSNQEDALTELAKSETDESQSIYTNESGEINPIKVLAIRGNSFTKMGHSWCRFIFDSEFKGDADVPVEFIIGNESNNDLVTSRCLAFVHKKTSDEELLKVKKRYQYEMKTAREEILNNGKNLSFFKLYVHNESRLPFRMIFIGNYLYLNASLGEKKAVDSETMKIPKSSSLYKVCEEYYDWIKKSAIEI